MQRGHRVDSIMDRKSSNQLAVTRAGSSSSSAVPAAPQAMKL
jgi:hypothetical protein